MSAVATLAAGPALTLRDGWRQELRSTLALSWPLILTNLAQTGLMTVDLVLVGRLGPQALAAGALGTNLFFGALFFGIGLASATAPMVAQERGRNRHAVRELRRTVRQALWAVTILSLPACLLLSRAEDLLLFLGQEPALAASAGAYVGALLPGVWPTLVGMVLRFFLAALERPGWATAVGLLALPVNLGLALWFMLGGLGVPALGLVGIGLATSLTAFLSLLALVAVIGRDRRLRRYRLLGRFWRPDWPRFWTVWRLGVPIGATLLFETGLFNATAFVMGLFGADELAAHALAMQVAALCFMVPLGLAQAAAVRVGRALGAGDRAGVGRAGWTALALATGFMALVALVQLAMPLALVAAFLDLGAPRNAPVIALTVHFLAFAALFALADGAQVVGAGMLRGLGDTRVPMLFAAFGYWGVGGAVGLALAFGAGLKGTGLWIGLASGLAVVAALMIRRWSRREALGLLDRPQTR